MQQTPLMPQLMPQQVLGCSRKRDIHHGKVNTSQEAPLSPGSEAPMHTQALIVLFVRVLVPSA